MTGNPRTKALGDFLIWLALMALGGMAVPLVMALAGQEDARVEALIKEGMVSEAVVTAVRQSQESYTDRKGRPHSRTVTTIDFTYNLIPKTSYADFTAAGDVLPPPQGTPAISSYSRDSSEDEGEAVEAGDSIFVVVHPDDPGRPELVSYVRNHGNLINLLLILLAVVGAGYSGWRSWQAFRLWRGSRG
jgi:hypothetical protein